MISFILALNAIRKRLVRLRTTKFSSSGAGWLDRNPQQTSCRPGLLQRLIRFENLECPRSPQPVHGVKPAKKGIRKLDSAIHDIACSPRQV